MSITPQRQVIYSKDVQNIYGCSLGHAQRILRMIRKANQKKPRQPVSVREFCEYTSLPQPDVAAAINGNYGLFKDE